MHSGFIQRQAVTKDLRLLRPKSGLTSNSCQSPFIWSMEKVWEPFNMDLEPQPMHTGFIQRQAVTRDLTILPKSKLISILVTAWWWIHNPIHSIWWWLSITFHMYRVGVGIIPCRFGASTTAHWLHSEPSSDQGFEACSSSQILIYQLFHLSMEKHIAP
jgi:hypothetical protein